MTQPAYIHTIYYGDDFCHFRVYPALVINAPGYQKGEATLIYVDHTDGIRVIKARHLNNRISAEYWVYAWEFDLMNKDIRDDYAARGCSHQAVVDLTKAEEAVNLILQNVKLAGVN